MLKLVERSGKWHIHGTHLGVRVRESTGLSISETAKAELLLARKIQEIELENGTPQAPSTQITLRQLMERMIEIKLLEGHQPGYRNCVQTVIRKLGELGDIDATKVVLNEVAIRQRLGSGLLKKTTVSVYLAHIKAAMNMGVEWGLLPNGTPMLKFKMAKGIRDDVWNKEQIEEATEYLKRDLDIPACALLIALHTGLRIGEVSRIKRATVDLENHVFQVEETGYARTKSKERDHPIRNVILPIFKYALENFSTEKSQYLFSVDPRGGRGMSLKSEPLARAKQMDAAAQRKMRAMCDETGLPRIRVHDLRHTFAKYMVANKVVDAMELKELLGHSQVTMTERYIGKIGISSDLKRRLNQV